MEAEPQDRPVDSPSVESGTGRDRWLVFDELSVGPVHLERRRITAPYRLQQFSGQVSETQLIYTYEEDVFDPEEPESSNLAAMMAVQVAINYGLFCRKVVLIGSYDSQDRRWIRSMMENTAREIYVNRLHAENPFLIRSAGDAPLRKRRRYCQAEIEFRSDPSDAASCKWRLWPTRKDRYCILSSGGKDSLLTYGLIDEILRTRDGSGAEASGHDPAEGVHPIFVNESGRHWFTALNAYRHFREHVPNTGRVWVNSDRVFSWFLKHMPFIRKDFASLRSDDYPIRLWTVAVFLFGVLPLVRKRGIGRLLIGDEYDTTRHVTTSGIRHYAGLYDQSVDFDHALSGYFLQKGWSVSQFSLLRPLSELLIQGLLVNRYPHLYPLQVSCHAAHKQGDRVVPCGRCEKCRRIVGMQMAAGADPTRCGYTEEQIEPCLQALVRKGTHQEGEGQQHLLYRLAEKGLLTDVPGRLRPRPEVDRLRFHPRHSPINGLPLDLRRPLFGICLAHADGAVKWIGRRWVEVELFSDPDFRQAYPFDLEPVEEMEWASSAEPKKASSLLWGELTWPDAQRRMQSIDLALLPVGAVEQHGPHLPLDTDAFDAAYLARRVAAACNEPKPLVLPLISYGVSYHHDEFKGTVSITNEALSRMVYDIGVSVAANGIRKLVIINGHGGNGPALHYAAQMINRDARIFVCVDSGETSDVDLLSFVETPNDVHAGEMETSTALAVRPHLVRMEQARPAVPSFSSRYLNFSSSRGVTWYAYTRSISPSGVMGDPTRASARKGAQMWEVMIAHLAAFVDDIKAMTLSEIHQRKY